ncbi:hypothetical protein OIDMADRAFT_35624 [Oidiodendron maius Zn]|uniref:Uncharacterized protein n=1 Tax=Oidiodendron maius (strain Zn) TaxID=913774 RepID=A0A0C3GQ30_OIDMZ|nr:hypothetical protein OIDMADRAFT_35624 [Oidiodendron maius Zn]
MKLFYYVPAMFSAANAIPQFGVPYCENPTTKDVKLSSLCDEVKGVVVTRIWKEVSTINQVAQPMCLVAGVLWSEYNPGPDEFTNEKCVKAFGQGYNGSCTFFARSMDDPAYPGYPHFSL